MTWGRADYYGTSGALTVQTGEFPYAAWKFGRNKWRATNVQTHVDEPREFRTLFGVNLQKSGRAVTSLTALQTYLYFEHCILKQYDQEGCACNTANVKFRLLVDILSSIFEQNRIHINKCTLINLIAFEQYRTHFARDVPVCAVVNSIMSMTTACSKKLQILMFLSNFIKTTILINNIDMVSAYQKCSIQDFYLQI